MVERPDSAPPPAPPPRRGLVDELRVRRRLVQFVAYLSATLARLRVELALAHGDAAKEAVREATKARTSRGLLDIFGIELTAGAASTRSERGRLVVANHRTAFDIGVMMCQFGGVMLSRGDLASWPVIGPLSREGRTIFVDRESGHSGARAIRAIRRALAAAETVIVYPEGTTYIGDEVRPFLPGAFAAARGLPVDIVPVGLAYDAGVEYFHTPFIAHLEQVAVRPRTRVVLTAGEPFPADGKSADLALRAHDAVQALVHQARAQHGVLAGARS